MKNANRGWATSTDERQDGHILATQDGGHTWVDITPPETASVGRQDGKHLLAAFLDSQHAWVIYWTIDQEFGPVLEPALWITDDSGQSWQKSQAIDLGDWEGGYSQPRFLEFVDPDHGMLLLGHDPGAGHAPMSVYSTSDGGLSWELVRSAMEEPGKAIDVCCQTGLAFLNPDNALMTMDPGPLGFTYWNLSRDGGRNWTLEHTPPADEQVFATGLCQTTSPQGIADGPVFVLVDCLADVNNHSSPQAWLYQSADLGKTWRFRRLPEISSEAGAGQNSQRRDRIDFQDGQMGWLASTVTQPADAEGREKTTTILYQTTDGGESWLEAGNLPGETLFSFIDPEQGWAITKADDSSTLIITTDGAASWQTIQPEIGTNNPAGIPHSLATAKPVIDGLPAGERIRFRRVEKISSEGGWGVAVNDDLSEHILRSRDDGLTWNEVTPPEPAASSPDFPKVVTPFFLDQDRAWAIFTSEPGNRDSNQVWRTTDGGDSWEASAALEIEPVAGTTSPLELYFINPSEGWLLVSHGAAAGSQPVSLYQTQDGGKNWTRILDLLSPASGTLNTCCQSGMQFVDQTNGIITTASGADLDPHVNWTKDGGYSWSRQDLNLPGVDPSAKMCATSSPSTPSHTSVYLIAVCKDSSTADIKPAVFLLHTEDFGKTWSTTPIPEPAPTQAAGQPTGYDYQLELLDETFGWLYVHSYFAPQGSGESTATTTIYQTNDNGKTWQEISQLNWSGSFSFSSQTEGWALASNGSEQALVETQNGGRTWKIIETRLIHEP